MHAPNVCNLGDSFSRSENVFNPAHLAVGQTDLDSMGMGGGLCQQILYDSPGGAPGALVSFQYDVDFEAWFDVLSCASVHGEILSPVYLLDPSDHWPPYFSTNPYSILISSAQMASLGVSMINGMSSNRGSFMMNRNASGPRVPRPRLSCRSTLDPKIFFESLRCMAFKYLSPTTCSNSAMTASKPANVLISYPEAYVWQVSRQTPTRLLSSTPSIIAATCSNLNPMLVPWPAVFSMMAVTPLV